MTHKTFAAIVLLTFILMSAPPTGYSQYLGTEPPVAVATAMAPAPSSCGPQPEALEFDSRLGPAIGTWPIWVVLPTQAGRAVIAFSTQSDNTNPKLPNWWGTKVGWFIKASYHGQVKLSGFNITDHSPVYFDIGTDETASAPVIDPEHPGGYATGLEGWAFFPSLLWLSKAGCYTLSAEWDGGMWRQTVPAGNIKG